MVPPSPLQPKTRAVREVERRWNVSLSCLSKTQVEIMTSGRTIYWANLLDIDTRHTIHVRLDHAWPMTWPLSWLDTTDLVWTDANTCNVIPIRLTVITTQILMLGNGESWIIRYVVVTHTVKLLFFLTGDCSLVIRLWQTEAKSHLRTLSSICHSCYKKVICKNICSLITYEVKLIYNYHAPSTKVGRHSNVISLANICLRMWRKEGHMGITR